MEELDDGLGTGPVPSADWSLTVGMGSVRHGGGGAPPSGAVRDFRASS